jgi:hypothetical protein
MNITGRKLTTRRLNVQTREWERVRRWWDPATHPTAQGVHLVDEDDGGGALPCTPPCPASPQGLLSALLTSNTTPTHPSASSDHPGEPHTCYTPNNTPGHPPAQGVHLVNEDDGGGALPRQRKQLLHQLSPLACSVPLATHHPHSHPGGPVCHPFVTQVSPG